ncbi:hypothetical protein JCM9279_002647 [Rhodotorula babjevae]
MRSYDFEENEPLDGQQAVTVKEHGTGRVLWTKTRELDDDEIVSTIFDSLHQPRWRVRRPSRGWYLILQRAASSADVDEPYIELAPVKHRRDGPDALELEFRLDGQARSAASASTATARPRSPSVRVDMPAGPLDSAPGSTAMATSLSTASAASAASAASSATPLNDASTSPTAHRRSRSSMSSPTKTVGPPPVSSATYRLRTSLPPDFHTGEASRSSLFGKLKNWVVEPPRRFCCVRVPAGGEAEEAAHGDEVVMAFEELPSGFFHPRLRGILSLSPSLIDASGLEPSFWTALACAYADVMEERDGYEAAQGGD